MVEEGTSVDCDLALVVHCASLVTRSENIPLASFPGLSQELGNEATLHNEASGDAVLFFFFYYVSHTFTFRVMETLSSHKAFTKVSFLQDVMCLHA